MEELQKKYTELHPEHKEPDKRWSESSLKEEIYKMEHPVTEETKENEEKPSEPEPTTEELEKKVDEAGEKHIEEGVKKVVENTDHEVDEEELERMREAYAINNQKIITIGEIVPVWKDGKPYAIMNDQYIPWNQAQKILKKQEIASLEAELKELENNPQ